MPLFEYRAKDRSGATVTGTVDAADERGAASMVRELGHLPMDVHLARRRPEREPSVEAGSAVQRYLIYPLWTGVNIKALALFYRQLATLLGSGMTLSEALRSAGNRTRGRLGTIIAEMQNNASLGVPMSETMVRYPKVFSRLQISLVRAGESGGLLEQMVDRIASYLEYELKVRKLIMKAVAYPVVTLVMALLAYICVPHLETAVKQGMGPFFSTVAPQLRAWTFGMLALVVVCKLLFQFETVRLVWDCFKSQFPGVGGNARKIAMTRFCRALAMLYSAGMPVAQSVDIAADACANIYIGRAIKYAIPAIQTGTGLTESLTRTGVVSPMVLDMLSVGERAGSTDASLQKVADYMDDELDASIHKIGIALFVLMLVVAGVIVGYIVIEFWQKYYGGIAKVDI